MTEALDSAVELTAQRFREAGIEVLDLSVREYPEEAIFIVLVREDDLSLAAEVGNAVDSELSATEFPGFVTVRRGVEAATKSSGRVGGVHDDRATELVRLIASRSRTSEAQPSLAYVRDAAENIAAATAPRHHLIFGRRGAGKTALMVEARRLVEDEGHLPVWMNIQTFRHEDTNRIYLYFVERVCDCVATYYRDSAKTPTVAVRAAELQERVALLLGRDSVTEADIRRLIPAVQQLISRFTSGVSRRLFVFLDDFYYLPRDRQPELLDMLHGSVRDSDAWLKIASIRHLTRWFQSSPPLGLQTGHDAGHLDLDVTLQDPLRAKEFLESVLSTYAGHANVPRLSALFSHGALDRLVLASGAVPRDYLTLAGGALTRAKRRSNARQVGAQDVNQAAGDAAQTKIQELEDDLAADTGSAKSTLAALSRLKAFCLEQEKSTYFRVDLRDKEALPADYAALTSLLEVRLTHLVDPSVSDRRKAGERAEVFMLDLSQFAGARLKQGLRVLDLETGIIVSKLTASGEPAKVGRTPRQLVGIYRSAPVLDLGLLHGA